MRRTQPRGRPPGPLGCRNRVELPHVVEKPGRIRIELRDVVDHQGGFDARCAEPNHVVDHQPPLDAETASNPATWSSNRAVTASNSGTWSTTRSLSMHRAPNPATWSTTNRLSMQKPRRTPPRGRATGQNPHRTQPRGRPPGPSRCTVRRNLPRGRPSGPLGFRNRVELPHVVEQPGRGRVEPRDVVDHQKPLDAPCAETRHVVESPARLYFSHPSRSAFACIGIAGNNLPGDQFLEKLVSQD
jgi:hypothetical protein